MQDVQAIRVIAIDDDPDDLAITRHHLNRLAGVCVEMETFSDPQEGHRACLAEPPDVLLLDYMMGSTTGIDVLASIRSELPELPVIMLTDHGNEEVAVRALHAGVSDYLPKDVISARSLRRSILNSIERARLEHDLRLHRQKLESTIGDLERRNAEIQSFYHELSHELKTPLTATREFISLVLDGVQGPISDGQRDSLETALTACDQVTAHINDIFDSARLETGKVQLQAEAQPLAAVLRRAVAYCAQKADGMGTELLLEIADPDMRAEYDERRLTQVLVNLIDNALKFTPSGGTVRVGAMEDEGWIRIAVSDTGRGISPQDQDRIFDRLYQVRASAGSRAGMGLGLHLCRQLIELHGGRIEVTSEQGSGSTFTCWLPSHAQHPTSEAV